MRALPALLPFAPAFLRPFFLMIKLEPIKTLEEIARQSPFTLSDTPVMPTRPLFAQRSSNLQSPQKMKINPERNSTTKPDEIQNKQNKQKQKTKNKLQNLMDSSVSNLFGEKKKTKILYEIMFSPPSIFLQLKNY